MKFGSQVFVVTILLLGFMDVIDPGKNSFEILEIYAGEQRLVKLSKGLGIPTASMDRDFDPIGDNRSKNKVKAPVGRPRFLLYLYVTLILLSIHIPLFTVFWYMPSSNASRGSVKSAVGAPHFFKILYLAIAKTLFLTKHFFRKLHLMPIRVLLSSFFHFLLVFYWLFPVTQGVIHFGHQSS